ncbi:MAG: DNA gyrase subunit B, partial [Pseudomonadales bacterium]
VQDWTDQLAARMEPLNTSRVEYQLGLQADNERHLHYPEASVVSHGVRRSHVLDRDFFASGDYAAFAAFAERTAGLIGDNGQVVKGEKSDHVATVEAAMDWLQTEALRGHSRQRYKGLGEMNPDQLWETTMDPTVRTMLRVSIEDAISADKMFDTLMGDQVEPRREFIEENALAVANLDV